jgi:hypothetical protein
MEVPQTIKSILTAQTRQLSEQTSRTPWRRWGTLAHSPARAARSEKTAGESTAESTYSGYACACSRMTAPFVNYMKDMDCLVEKNNEGHRLTMLILYRVKYPIDT